jgi:hypothetical protein
VPLLNTDNARAGAENASAFCFQEYFALTGRRREMNQEREKGNFDV